LKWPKSRGRVGYEQGKDTSQCDLVFVLLRGEIRDDDVSDLEREDDDDDVQRDESTGPEA
jgi:hypothetical protein